MILDNESIAKGDRVFDLLKGEGIVYMIDISEVTVQFTNISGTRTTVKYVGNGIYNGAKRLYWKDPIIIAPPKNDDKWTYIKQAVVKILQLIKSVQ